MNTPDIPPPVHGTYTWLATVCIVVTFVAMVIVAIEVAP